jgi:endoglucanase
MKNPATKALLSVVAFILFVFMNQAQAQVQTPKYGVSMTPNTHGYYEYLPQGYSSGKNFPLMVFLHGVGEEGDGSTSSLPTILRNGPPRVISQGGFPTSFTVNGQTFSFIVISPQFVNWPSASDVDQIINYCVANYHVDQSRIYVTGLSMGGGVTWDYAGSSSAAANRIAALLPISGASYPDMTRSRTIAGANLPVWALHNQADPTVTVTNTTGYVANINLAPSPNPLAKMTIFNANGHDAWSNVYNMSYTEGGLNCYQWMLQYSRGGATSTPPTSSNISPVSNPGAGQTITLPANSVTLNGSGSSDPDGSISSYQWLQVVGPNNASFSSTSSATTSVSNLVAGTYTFRLIVTDNKGATTANTVNIVVNAATTVTPTTSGTIHVEAESYASFNSVMTQSTSDVGGGLNVGGANTGSWMDYNVNVPSAGTYSLNVRIATPNSGAQLQLKAVDGTVLGTAGISSTNGWQTWATFKTNVTLPAGTQKLRVYDANGAWNFNWFELVPSSTSSTPAPTPTPTPATGSTIHMEAESYASFNAAMTQTTSDIGGGLNVGGVNTGSWMDYNVTTSSAGTYTLKVRVATPNTGQIQLKAVDGTVLGTVTIPSTNGWQSWSTFTTNVTLPAGTQKLRIYDASGAWNFNWFELVPGSSSTTTTTSTPTVVAATIKVEAENYVKGNAVMTQTTSDAGGGLNVGGINTGSWMDYSVNVAAAGNYTFSARIATPNTGVQLQVLKSDGTVLGTISLPSTNGWQTWTNVSGTIALAAGTQTIRVLSLTGSWNFNYFQLTPSASAIATAPSTLTTASASNTAFTVSPNPYVDNFTVSVNNTLTGAMTVQMADASGAVKKTFNLIKDVTGQVQIYLSASDLTSGTYTITVYMGTWSSSTSIVKQ